MKRTLLILSLLAVGNSYADTPIKDITITGSASQIKSGAFAVKSGATVTVEAGATLDTTAGTVKVGTVSSGTNANVVVDANGTGKFQVNDTVTTATNADLVVDPDGTGKLDLRAAPLKAGTATAGTAPVKFTAGTILTAAEAGAVEFDGSWFYYSNSTPTRKRFTTEANAFAIPSAAIDWSVSSVFTKTLAANTTFTFSNATDGQTIVVALTNTASNYTVTWPTVSWSGGAAPTQTIGAKTDVYTFIRIGSTYYGSAVQNF
ncbi:MAG: hypothetical protein LC734_11465 [Acidobacteria bacterium]|nr:hypothetical protein [Acidobacteriota bacterium]